MSVCGHVEQSCVLSQREFHLYSVESATKQYLALVHTDSLADDCDAKQTTTLVRSAALELPTSPRSKVFNNLTPNN